MAQRDLTMAILTGCLAIVFGLVPGLYQGLVEGALNAIHRFRDQMTPGLPAHMEYAPVSETELAGWAGSAVDRAERARVLFITLHARVNNPLQVNNLPHKLR